MGGLVVKVQKMDAAALSAKPNRLSMDTAANDYFSLWKAVKHRDFLVGIRFSPGRSSQGHIKGVHRLAVIKMAHLLQHQTLKVVCRGGHEVVPFIC